MTRCSIILPTTRLEGLRMPLDCLSRQTMRDWQLIIVVPEALLPGIKIKSDQVRVIAEPPKRPGDFYRLNGAWNAAIKVAETELLIFMVDWIWFEPDALERFCTHFDAHPTEGVTSVGDHYRTINAVTGRPEVMWAQDDRIRDFMAEEARFSAMYELFPPRLMELALASLPRSKIIEVGGFDEEYDKYAAQSEKELCCRLYETGVRFVIDPDLAIRNWTHQKSCSATQWDDAYEGATELYKKHLIEIEAGTRKKLA